MFHMQYLLNAKNWLILAAVFAASISITYAQDIINSSKLINEALQYDKEVVIYQGEVIGEVMVRGNYAWLNVNDGENAIGVWLEKDLVNISYAGSYQAKGDYIEVTGVFNRACLLHGGDLDIHASQVKKIQQGSKITEILDFKKVRTAIILGAAWFLMLILSMYREQREKKPRINI